MALSDPVEFEELLEMTTRLAQTVQENADEGLKGGSNMDADYDLLAEWEELFARANATSQHLQVADVYVEEEGLHL